MHVIEKEDKKSADTNTSNTSNASTGNIDRNAEVSFNEKSSSSISLAEDLYQNEQNNKNITSKENDKIHAKSVEVLDPLEVLKASQDVKRRRNDENNNNNDLRSQVERSIFRLGRSDTWGCMHCRIRDDKWFMRTHHCSGLARMITKANYIASSKPNHSKLPNVENERKELKVESP